MIVGTAIALWCVALYFGITVKGGKNERIK